MRPENGQGLEPLRTYHRDVFWPAGQENRVELNPGNLSWSRHTLERAEVKSIPILDKLCQFDVIEVDSTGKQTIRTRLSQRLDLVLVVRNSRVVTCWTNDRNDKHRTLDRSRYAGPDK